MNSYCSYSKRLLQIKFRGARVSLTDRKVALRDGVKTTDGPKKEDRNKLYHCTTLLPPSPLVTKDKHQSSSL